MEIATLNRAEILHHRFLPVDCGNFYEILPCQGNKYGSYQLHVKERAGALRFLRHSFGVQPISWRCFDPRATESSSEAQGF
jgi:hypothetical protein